MYAYTGLFKPSLTCIFKCDEGTKTNNFSEAYNRRLKLKIGQDPNLARFLRRLRQEVFTIEVQYTQRHLSTVKRKRAERMRIVRRLAWETKVQLRLQDAELDGVGLLTFYDLNPFYSSYIISYSSRAFCLGFFCSLVLYSCLPVERN